jgi:hypothetical protein
MPSPVRIDLQTWSICRHLDAEEKVLPALIKTISKSGTYTTPRQVRLYGPYKPLGFMAAM